MFLTKLSLGKMLTKLIKEFLDQLCRKSMRLVSLDFAWQDVDKID